MTTEIQCVCMCVCARARVCQGVGEGVHVPVCTCMCILKTNACPADDRNRKSNNNTRGLAWSLLRSPIVREGGGERERLGRRGNRRGEEKA